MNTKKSTNDLTNGSIIKVLILFTLPILFSNLLQQLYNIVDTAVIGNFLGDSALASVGAAGPVYEIIIGIASGFGNGFSVIIARFFGAHRDEDLKQAVTWSYIFSILISFILTVFGIIGIRPLLLILRTPASIIDNTVVYMQIIIGFSIITIFYNLFAGMLRAIGNSRTPLFFLAVATILNIILDIVFVKYFHLGISGVGYATVIAQLLSVILCIIYINKKCPVLHFDRNYAVKDMELINELLTTGLSMALMYVVVSIGSVALQSSVNSFGEQTIAAHNAARKIDSFLIMPIGAINAAAATFTSQNYGANKIRRVKRGLTSSLSICFIWGIIATIIAYSFGEEIIKILTGSQDTILIKTALQYVKINILFVHALSVLVVLRSSLQGVGRKIIPLFGSIIELVIKFAAVGYIAPALGYFGICILEPVIWSICAVVVLIDYLIFLKRDCISPA